MRYVYGLTSALLLGGAAFTLVSGHPAGAQIAQNDEAAITRIAPKAGAPRGFAELTAQLQPAVVNIATRQQVEINANPFAGTPFENFFGRRGQTQPQTQEAQSLGSGFIISAQGYVVTNNHVVSPDSRATLKEITVTTHDGNEYEAELVGADAASDLAVLKIKSNKSFPFVKFGDSSKARPGDWVIAIGNPFGLGGTVTAGIISAVYRNTGSGGAYDRYLQTDASINRGNSGGPLFDMAGKVIGINNAIFSPSGGSVGIGFAIPSEIAAPIVEKLIAGEEIERGYLGVTIQRVDEDLADSLGLPHNRGEIVQSVQPGGAAEKAGIKPGDIVLKVDGKEVTKDQTLSYLIANIKPGTRVPIEVFRDGKRRVVYAVVAKRPSEEELREQQLFDPDADAVAPDASEEGSVIEEKLGLQLLTLTPQIAAQLGVAEDTKGLVIGAVSPGSDAARKGLRRGDIILSANYRKVETIDALEQIIEQAVADRREAILLRIQRRGRPAQYIAVRMREG